MLRRAGLPNPGTHADVKSSGDYVTASDRASEAAILEVLRRESPGVAVLAEEAGGSRGGTMWAVDPLDGTTNFIHGYPQVGVSVGLIEDRRPVVGVVIAPFLDVEFAGVSGAGVTRNGSRLARLHDGDARRAVVATGFPFRRKDRLPQYLALMERALETFEDLRRAGAAALDLTYTAAGVFDGFFELGLNTWDVAAGAALILEVGGRVTDWSGGDTWIETGDIIAAPPGVHAELLALATSGRESA